jgi:hypothetical protein
MTKRSLLLAALTVALLVPAVSLADDGNGNAGTPSAAAKGGRAAMMVERLGNRLDRRFQAFSSRCLVSNPPERCAKVANRFVHRLEKLQERLRAVEARIKTKCSAANPPERCANAGRVTQAIDDLLAKLASDEAAITQAFANAGNA